MHNQFKTPKLKHPMLAMGPRDLNSAPYSPVHCSSHSMASFQSCELTNLQTYDKNSPLSFAPCVCFKPMADGCAIVVPSKVAQVGKVAT